MFIKKKNYIKQFQIYLPLFPAKVANVFKFFCVALLVNLWKVFVFQYESNCLHKGPEIIGWMPSVGKCLIIIQESVCGAFCCTNPLIQFNIQATRIPAELKFLFLISHQYSIIMATVVKEGDSWKSGSWSKKWKDLLLFHC